MSNDRMIEEVKKELRETLKSIVEGINEFSSIQIEVEEPNIVFVDSIRIDLNKIDEVYSQIKSQIDKLKELLDTNKIDDDISNLIGKFNEKFIQVVSLHSELKTAEMLENLTFKADTQSKFLQNIENIKDALSELVNLIRDIESKFRNKKKILQTTFMSRDSVTLNKIDKIIASLQKLLADSREKYIDLSTSIQNRKILSTSQEAINVAYAISRGERIWTTDFISRITGIRSIAGELYTEEVEIEGLEHYLGEEKTKVTIDTLLYRYPPYEPIQIPEGVIIGRFVWFLKAKNAIIYDNGSRLNTLNHIATFDLNTGKLISIKPLQLLYLDREACINETCKEVLLEIKEKNGIIYVKYGSKKLCNNICKSIKGTHGKGRQHELIDINAIVKKLQREYEENYMGYRKKTGEEARAYSTANLGYVWYCQLGLGMSTDPYDLQCPFIDKCHIGKHKQGKCDNWSWSRRLYPKVFVVSERDAFVHSLVYDKNYSFIKPFYIEHTYAYELFKYVQWNIPTVLAEGPIVTLELETPITKTLPQTNVVGFEIPLSLLKALILTLLDAENPNKPQVTIMYPHSSNAKVSLDKLLISKWFIYNATKEGKDSFSFLQKSPDKILDNFNKFVNQFNEEELINFAIKCIAHTLAHLFLTFISINLEIELENLLYIFKVDEKRDAIMVMVAENSAWGSLNIVDHAIYKFGSLTNMIKAFIDFVSSMLQHHENDVERFTHSTIQRISIHGLKSDVKMKIKSIADMLRQRFKKFIDTGLILDPALFLNNIVLSEEDKKIIEELNKKGVNVDTKELRSWLIDSITVAGISSCIDGCTACVMLEHGCVTPLMQNIYLSRNLVLWLLRVLKGEVVKGRGKILGIAIFNQTKDEFFAMSPYIDDDGTKLLIELAKRNVKVKLITSKMNAEKYGELLKRHGIEVNITKTPRHDKFYIIDKKVMIISSQNLSAFSSINDFTFRVLEPAEAEEIEKQNLKSDVVDRY
uniref:PLD phosphodiesterase domain-containing protein n=1 Tax=Ignisphaera aggregans TaxID=334771 RepID=A0A7J2TAS3_9CREN